MERKRSGEDGEVERDANHVNAHEETDNLRGGTS